MTWEKRASYKSPDRRCAAVTLSLIIAGTLLCSNSLQAVEKSSELQHGYLSPMIRRDSKPHYQESEILVKFRKDASKNTKNELHARHKSTILRDFARYDLHLIRLQAGTSVEEAIKEYAEDPSVEYAQPNHIGMVQLEPNDTDYKAMWAPSIMRLPSAWDITTGTSEIIIGVIDTGVDYTHPDLLSNLRNDHGSFGYNAVTQTDDPFDDNGHGTHIAGTIGAEGNNGLGIAGINWNIKVLACKAFGSDGYGTEADVIDCLQYLMAQKVAGANIVATNNSYSFGTAYPHALYDAISDQQILLYVTAAGNAGLDTDREAAYPASFKLPNVLSVAATDSVDALAPFSNFGRYGVHLGAPGVGILSTYLQGGYGSLSGTSMATAQVTGLVGLLQAQDLTRDWITLRNLVLAGGDPIPSMAGKTISETRLNAFGSLTCSGKILFSPWEIPVTPVVGRAETVSVINVRCGEPAGEIITVAGNGDHLVLKDDGSPPDLAANDGIYTGSWNPSSTSTTFSFTSSTGTIKISSPPLRINEPMVVVPAIDLGNRATSCTKDLPCSISFSKSGGTPPTTWSVISGALPAGLSLDPGTGAISGKPATSGVHRFTLKAADSAPMSDSLPWSITVNEGLRPGWPQKLQKRRGWGALNFSASPIVADLNGDGLREIIIVDNDNPDLLFGGFDTLYVFNPAGALLAQTPLPGLSATPVVADIDNDGKLEILLAVGQNTSSQNHIYVYRADLSPMPNFPAGGYPSYSGGTGFVHSLTVADLNNDGDISIISISSPDNANDDHFGKNVVSLVDGNGAPVPGWPVIAGDFSYNDVISAVADIDAGGKKNLVLATQDGYVHIYRKDGTERNSWRFSSVPVGWMSTPVVADLANDGSREIIIRYSDQNTGDTLIGVFTPEGSLLPNWPRRYQGSTDSGISVADVDNDGRLEIIFVAGAYLDQIYAVTLSGARVPGWPATMRNHSSYGSDILAADLDNNGRLEVFASGSSFDNYTGKGESAVFGFSSGGTPLPGFPKFTTPDNEIRSTAGIGALDSTGAINLVQKSEDGMLYVWDFKAGQSGQQLAWPTKFYNNVHTSSVTASKAYVVRPDLTCSQVTAPDSAGTGTSIIVGDTTTNSSTVQAPASTTFFYLSANSAWDPADTLLGSREVPELAAGATNSGAASVTLPPGTRTGTWYILAKADGPGTIIETNENNNSAWKKLLVGPDLTVSTVTAPAVAGAGLTISVGDTTKNAGGGEAAACTTYYYLSSNSVWDANDTYLGSRSIPKLEAGATSVGTTSVTIPAGVRTGAWYLIAKADGSGSVPETNEGNNTAAKRLLIGPDLTVSAVTAPARAGAGVTITVGDTTKNSGGGDAPASTTAYYLSANPVWDSADTYLGSRSIPTLAPAETSIGTASVTLPAGLSTGTWYIIAKTDAEGHVPETIETNNAASKSFVAGPDLTVSAATAPGSAGAGATITVGDTTRNSGAGEATASTTQYYLSTNRLWDAGDTFLGSRNVPVLAAGATSTGTVSVTLPATLTTGTWYVVAKADGPGSVTETNETNNSASKSLAVGPDLTVSALTAPVAGAGATTITVADTTRNGGAGEAPASTTYFYLSADSILDAGDVYLGSRSIPALATGSASTGTTSVTLPAGLSTGTWYIIAKADGSGTVAETKETNNTASKSIVVGPDLTVSTVSAPANASAGTTITVGDRTKNSGGGDAPASTTGYYLSADPAWDVADACLGSHAVPALPPGATSLGTALVTLPAGLSAGTWYIIAKVNDSGTVIEGIRTNNTAYKSFQVN